MEARAARWAGRASAVWTRQGSPPRAAVALPEFLDRVAGQGVHALVEGIAAVAAHLVPGDVVAPGLGEQALPEIAVGHRLLVGPDPAGALPALPPAVTEAGRH